MENVLLLKTKIEQILHDNKAIDVKTINLEGKSTVADYMIVASGTSSRHLQALSEMILEHLKRVALQILLFSMLSMALGLFLIQIMGTLSAAQKSAISHQNYY